MADASASLPPPPGRHAYSLQYLRLQLFALVLRSLIAPLNWLGKLVIPYGVSGVVRHSFLIPSRDKGRRIRVWAYECSATRHQRKAVVLNWHGSGFMTPGLTQDAAFCAQLARQLDCVVLDCDYRKAPSHPFPAAPNDAEDAVRWVLSKTERFDTSRIALTGFSAGGNLALSVSNSLGPSLISAVATFYAPTNFTLGDGVKRAPEGQPFKPLVWVFRQFALAYLPKGTRREHPRLSVLFAPPERYPGTVLCICGAMDTLHEDSVRLCKRLQEAGGQDVEFISAPGRRHGWDKGLTKAAREEARGYYRQVGLAIERSWQKKPARESRL
ncbi:alpha/beta-hydrolase [Tilletiopsis washingtonensis]|uniref:Alpha/beta-hydrolase n=1 Tax=Tilletiopsis washingtonensis TaxID=58919 RepID=A0A316Z569_9BASI|nr:alpha/beta-hydrolase [Tilletiopsis washingtonensis]PWN95303.1 alpha/beta-hydrolase [Tilletiopsis washingtonensis]